MIAPMSLSLFGRRSPRQIHAEATPLSACRLSPTRLCDSKLFDVTQLAEIDADGVGRGPVLEYRRRWEGRCGTNSRKRELIEPRIAARLSDAHETERARWSDRKCHRRTSSLARLRLFPREHRPDICVVASCVVRDPTNRQFSLERRGLAHRDLNELAMSHIAE